MLIPIGIAIILLIPGSLFCGLGKALGSLVIGFPAGAFVGVFVSGIFVDIFFPYSGPSGLGYLFIGVIISGIVGYIVALIRVSRIPMDSVIIQISVRLLFLAARC